MLKRLVSAVVGATCIAATVGVSATTPNVSTTTVYNGTDTSKIKVTSTVQDAATGNIYTYLASTAETVTQGSDIVYIDQKTGDGTNVVFEYVTESTGVNATVKVGGKSSDGTAYTAASGTIPAAKTSINVTVDEGTEENQDLDLSKAKNDDYVPIDLGDTTKVVASIKLGGEDFTDYFVSKGKVWIKKSDLTQGEKIEIAAKKETAASEIAAPGAGFLKGTEEGAVDSIIVMGKIEGAATSYGVEISSDESFSDSTPYEALGKGTDGMFAVKLENLEGGGMTAGTYYARVYFQASEDAKRTYADRVFKIDTTQSTDTPGSVVK